MEYCGGVCAGLTDKVVDVPYDVFIPPPPPQRLHAPDILNNNNNMHAIYNSYL